MSAAHGPVEAIRALLRARLENPINAETMNQTVAVLSPHADGPIASAIEAVLEQIPWGAGAAQVARPLVEMSLLLASLKEPLEHRRIVAEACYRARRSLADLPNQPERAPSGWFAAEAFFPARRRCMAQAAREAGRHPDRSRQLLDLLAFDDAGAFAPFVAALGEAPDSTETLALATQALPSESRRALVARHAAIDGISLCDGLPILHAGECPAGLRRPLTPAQRDVLGQVGPAPVLWWWLESGWPPQQERRTNIMINWVPGFVRDMLRRGEARLLINCGHEISFIDAFFADRLRALADMIGCDPACIVYVAQNPNVVDRYAALPLEASKGRRSVVCTGSTPLLLPWTDTPASTESVRARPFLCFNNIPHVFRAALLLRAVRDGIAERGYLSFNWGFTAPLPPGSEPITSDRLRPYFPDMAEEALAALMAAVEPRLPIRLDLGSRPLDSHGRGEHVDRFSGDLTSDAYFMIVTESDMEWPDHTRRFTEKTVKPLASCNPFIIFGNAGVLAGLRELGFETFGDVIDEAYDEIADPVQRFDAAYRQFKTIATMSIDNHAALYRRLLPRLERNRRHLAGSRDWFVQKIQAAIVAAAG